ncbi:TFIIA-alpha and beta-like factor isoform X2 [Tamandua tetradactyla]|uniref:TFIIA-alpha and beta-like factor isoform X2 n=1 Tax=Tamandua tetradactyla TaxID=48850 RepID=UPI004053F89D
MAYVNPVPKLYRSVIEDVIEGVRDLFAEEGIEEQVLKDLKQLWETKVLQSKATEDFFSNTIHSFTLQLPHSLHQTLQTSTASLVIPGRTIPSLTTTELGTSNSSANLTFPSSIGYHIHVPAGATLQTVSGHLYKINVPIMVTQTSGRASILQQPIQQIVHQLGQPSIIQTSVPQLNPSSVQSTTEKSQRLETVLQQPTILHSGTVDRKHLENATSDVLVSPENEYRIMSKALLNPQDSSQYINLPGVVIAPPVSQTGSNLEPMLSVSASVAQNMHGGPFSMVPQGALHQHMSDVQLHVIKNTMYGYDSVKQQRNTEASSSLPISEKDSNSQLDLRIQSPDDINEIIQIDGTGDTSSKEDIGNTRDVDENEFLGIIDVEDLKVLEEEGDSLSNEDSTVNSSDNEDSQIDTVEEIHRSKNKWKFYLKDGVMCFGGRDYVFAKAIGDAEW